MGKKELLVVNRRSGILDRKVYDVIDWLDADEIFVLSKLARGHDLLAIDCLLKQQLTRSSRKSAREIMWELFLKLDLLKLEGEHDMRCAACGLYIIYDGMNQNGTEPCGEVGESPLLTSVEVKGLEEDGKEIKIPDGIDLDSLAERVEHLGKRYPELVALIASGLNNKRIAVAMRLERHTVATYTTEIYRVLNLKGVLGISDKRRIARETCQRILERRAMK